MGEWSCRSNLKLKTRIKMEEWAARRRWFRIRQQTASSCMGNSLLVVGDKGLEGCQQSWGSVLLVPCWGNTGHSCAKQLTHAMQTLWSQAGCEAAFLWRGNIAICHWSGPLIWDSDDLSNHLFSNDEYFKEMTALVSETDCCVFVISFAQWTQNTVECWSLTSNE